MTKIILTLLVLLSFTAAQENVEPLVPICVTAPVADLLPISVGETLAFDLENIFYGTFEFTI